MAERRNGGVTLSEAVIAARRELSAMTGLAVDQVSGCDATEEGWRITVDLLETKARIGRNDLIATFVAEIDASGSMTGFSRAARAFREDRTGREVAG
ncbi:MAG: gas vesicle protein GvpO [Pseudomonadota bacterium]